MANEDHVAIVKQGAEAIRRWREEHPGQRLMLDTADLSGTDLSGADLRGAFLYKADLRGTTLSWADLRKAILAGADLRKATLIEADLRRADLGQADLWRADLRGADLQRADLKGTDLSETFLTSAILYKADFRDARLAGAILADVEGAHQACGLETTRLTLVPHTSTGTDSTPGQPSPETTPTLSPPDQPHDDFNFGTCIRPWPERLVDWECLRRVGQLPLFGASYTALSLILILFYGLALYNDQVKWVHTQAEQIMAQPDQLLYRLASLILARFQPLPIPQQSLLLLVSTLLLVIGSTLYTSSCPPRIKEFSRDQWCYQLGRSLLHYWPLAWKYRYIRLVCAACYTLGGLGVGYVLLMKVGRVLLFILKNSPYPWLWR